MSSDTSGLKSPWRSFGPTTSSTAGQTDIEAALAIARQDTATQILKQYLHDYPRECFDVYEHTIAEAVESTLDHTICEDARQLWPSDHDSQFSIDSTIFGGYAPSLRLAYFDVGYTYVGDGSKDGASSRISLPAISYVAYQNAGDTQWQCSRDTGLSLR